MQRIICGLLVFLTACQSSQPPSLNMLNKRSDYDGDYLSEELNRDTHHFILRSSASKSKFSDIRVHPRELPTGDLFLGGWIRTSTTPFNPPLKKIQPKAPPPAPSNQARVTGKD